MTKREWNGVVLLAFMAGALGGTLVALWIVPRLCYRMLRAVTRVILAGETARPAAPAPTASTVTTTGPEVKVAYSDVPTPAWKSKVVN